MYEGIDVLTRFLTSIISLVMVLAISASTSAQIRVVSYNSAQFHGDAIAMTEVFQVASSDDSHGFAIPVSIFLFQEVDIEELNTLQKVVGAIHFLPCMHCFCTCRLATIAS